MTGHDIRQGFLQFFADRGHTIVPSSSLVPGMIPPCYSQTRAWCNSKTSSWDENRGL